MKVKKSKLPKTYRFEFPITLTGCGTSKEYAWQDAVEAFMEDPGYFETFKKGDEV